MRLLAGILSMTRVLVHIYTTCRVLISRIWPIEGPWSLGEGATLRC